MQNYNFLNKTLPIPSKLTEILTHLPRLQFKEKFLIINTSVNIKDAKKDVHNLKGLKEVQFDTLSVNYQLLEIKEDFQSWTNKD